MKATRFNIFLILFLFSFTSFTHHYVQYDLASNLLEESLINDLRTVQYCYDTQGTLGIKQGSKAPYMQGATFDENNEFESRTDVTDHGRKDHPNPHYHPASGPNSAKSPPQPISN